MRLLTVLLGLVLMAGRVSAEETQPLKSKNDVLNYAIGVETARNLKKEGIDVDLDLMLKGMKDVLSGGKILIPEQVLRKTMNDLQSELRRNQTFSKRILTEENRKQSSVGETQKQKQ